MKLISLISLNLLVVTLAGAGGYFLHQKFFQQHRGTLVTHRSSTVQQSRPLFSLPDLNGRLQKNSQWDGKVVVLNFWATWCPPCISEIPVFIELQEHYQKYPIQFVGVAVDNVERTRLFAKRLSINYPILVDEDKAIEVAQKFGNVIGVLPFTAVINPQGIIVSKHPGELNREQLEEILSPWIKNP